MIFSKKKKLIYDLKLLFQTFFNVVEYNKKLFLTPSSVISVSTDLSAINENQRPNEIAK
jgi:hypothetical protein